MAANGPALDLEDEVEENGSSIAELPSFFVRALYDFDSTDASSLSFKKGALIEVLTQLESGWWDGLLSNDVRGWFPSNYVERISDEEAEVALQAEEELSTPSKASGSHNVMIVANGQDASMLAMQNASSTTTDSQYAGLGLGKDFDNLRKLMDGMSIMPDQEGMGDGDVFEQLAHASLHDSTSRDSKTTVKNNTTHPIAAARPTVKSDKRRSSRLSQISQAGSSLTGHSVPASNQSHATDINVASASSRSAFGSTTDVNGIRRSVHLAADDARARDSMEKERGRSHTFSNTSSGSNPATDPSLLKVMTGRPRAQTADAGGTSTPPVAASGNATDTKTSGNVDAKWVTRVNARGEIFYLNTSTGERAQDIANEAALASGIVERSSDANSFWVPKVNARGEIFYLNTHTGERAHDIPTDAALASGIADEDDLLDSDELEAEERLQETDSTSASKGDAFVRRRGSELISTEDSRPSTASSSLYMTANKQARGNAIESMPDQRDVPWPWLVRPSEDERSFHFYNRQTQEIAYDLDEVVGGAVGAKKFSQVRSRSSDATINNRISSRDGRQSSTSRRMRETPAASKFSDERDALNLQQSMQENCYKPLRDLINEAGDAIAVLAAMASESIGADGLSEADSNTLNTSTSSLHDSSRLSMAMANVVRTIRDLLHASGVLSIAPADMASAAQTVQRSLFVNDVLSIEQDAVVSFKRSISTLQSANVQDLTDSSDAYVAYAGLSAVAGAPQTLVPLGKKINATLSKLVLSARSVVEQSCLNAENRPTFTEAQLEKILSYRQRIRDDSIELARALGSFKIEASRSPVNPATSVPFWMRRNTSQVSSASGVAGIGRKLYGGGAAARWRGHGFVLPSATEAAALRAESKGAYQNPFELTKEAREALTSGRVVLHRKPTRPLNRSTLEETLIERFTLLNECLNALHRLSSQSDVRSICDEVQELSASACLQFGSLITLLEETDLASSIDVDGPPSEQTRLSGQVDEYSRSVVRAGELLYTFVLTKQMAQDNYCLLLMDAQDALDAASLAGSASVPDGLLDGLHSLSERLLGVNAQMQSTLIGLLDVIELQIASNVATLGARSKVYGVENVKLEKSSAAQDDVIYLGPGLAIPNGPPSATATTPLAPQQPTSAASSITDVKSPGASTTAPSSIKSLFQRSRSSTNPTNIGPPSAAFVEAHNNSVAKNGAGQEALDNTFTSRFASKVRRDTIDGALSAATSVHDGASADGGDAASALSVRQVEEVPWFLHADTPPNDIILAPTGQVKGATLPALMERLTMHNAFDASFNNTFLTTYQSFTSTDELLDLLFARFRLEEPHGLTDNEHEMWVEKKQRPIRFRVFNVLKTWLESNYNESEHERHMQRIKDFATGEMVHSPAMTTPANLLLRIIERRSGTGEQMKITMVMPASAPPPILPKNFRKIKFLDIDPLEMARQLTLMDSRLYNRIRPAECLRKAWSRENGAEIAQGVRDVISANNRVSGWVSEAILVQEDVKKRAAWVKQFVAIADRCFSLNNFSSMMAIYSGLNNASLNRLRRTWDAVNQRHLQLFDNMRAILAPTRNFTKYRETLRKLNPPCVPFLGVYLTDLTFIEDGNADRMRTDERLINFSKRQMTAEKIQEIMIYQSTPYNLTPVPGIQKFIEENLIEARSDDELFEQSLRLEPREREDEKIARLLQESGFL